MDKDINTSGYIKFKFPLSNTNLYPFEPFRLRVPMDYRIMSEGGDLFLLIPMRYVVKHEDIFGSVILN